MKKLLCVILISAAVSAVSRAEAQEQEGAPENRGFVSLLAGPIIITSEGGGTHLAYGARLGFILGRSNLAEGSLGLAISRFADKDTVEGLDFDTSVTFIAAEYVARYAFGTGLYFGARAGLGIGSIEISADGDSIDAADTSFTYAPVLGYEVKFSDQVNLVFDAAWINMGSGTYNFEGVKVDHDGGAGVTLKAGVAFNF